MQISSISVWRLLIPELLARLLHFTFKYKHVIKIPWLSVLNHDVTLFPPSVVNVFRGAGGISTFIGLIEMVIPA